MKKKTLKIWKIKEFEKPKEKDNKTFFFLFYISVFLYTKPQERKSILKKKSFFDAAIETCMTLLYTKLAQYHLRNFQNELLIAFRFSEFVQNEAQKISVDKSIIIQMFRKIFKKRHSVWKSQNKSHSTLRAKRAKFTFWVN